MRCDSEILVDIKFKTNVFYGDICIILTVNLAATEITGRRTRSEILNFHKTKIASQWKCSNTDGLSRRHCVVKEQIRIGCAKYVVVSHPLLKGHDPTRDQGGQILN